MKCQGRDGNGVACVVEDLQPGDKFCYVCGTPLPLEMSVASQAIPTLGEPPFWGCPGCGQKTVNDRGFCIACKTRCRYPLRDDYIIDRGPLLAARSHLGKGKKERNEDYALVASRQVFGQVVSWLVLSDGLSQSQNPHLAAEAACKAASSMIERMIIDGLFDPKNVLGHALVAANNAVLQVPGDPSAMNEQGKPAQPPKTSIVIALMVGGQPYLCWAGDSRIYALYSMGGRPGARKLTRDDSELEVCMAQGMPYKEAAAKPNAGLMRRCLGMTEGQGLVPNFAELAPKALTNFVGLVACTDGVYSSFDPGPDPETGKGRPAHKLGQAYLDSGGNAAILVDQLVRTANDGSAEDNNTAAAIFLQPQSMGE